MRRSAFTVVEIVIAMLVMGIMAAAAMPRYRAALSRYRVDAAAQRIAADLNHVRARANMVGAGGTGEWVSFYPTSDSYRLYNDPDIDRPSEEYFVYFGRTSYPVDLVSAEFTNVNGYSSNYTVKYDYYGTAKSGNPPTNPDAPLSSGQIVVAAGGQQRTVVIHPITGIASVQ